MGFISDLLCSKHGSILLLVLVFFLSFFLSFLLLSAYRWRSKIWGVVFVGYWDGRRRYGLDIVFIALGYDSVFIFHGELGHQNWRKKGIRRSSWKSIFIGDACIMSFLFFSLAYFRCSGAWRSGIFSRMDDCR